MEKRIITISREFGSGGRTIGKLVAEHLGIRCYDAELIQKLAAESGFDENYVKEAGEYTPGGFLASAFTDRSFGPTNEDLLWKLQWSNSDLCAMVTSNASSTPVQSMEIILPSRSSSSTQPVSMLNLQALSSYFMFVSFLPYGTLTVICRAFL